MNPYGLICLEGQHPEKVWNLGLTKFSGFQKMGYKGSMCFISLQKKETPLHNKYGGLENHLQKSGWVKNPDFCSVASMCFSGDSFLNFFGEVFITIFHKITIFKTKPFFFSLHFFHANPIEGFAIIEIPSRQVSWLCWLESWVLTSMMNEKVVRMTGELRPGGV